MTIVVTGGAGFIGSNFIFHILDKPGFRIVKLDICDRDDTERLFVEERPDMVVNFAAETHVDRSIENPQFFWKQIAWGPVY